MRSFPVALIILLVCVLLVGGCTTSDSNIQAEQSNIVPTQNQTTISTPIPTFATQPTIETQTSEATLRPTASPSLSEEVILDEGTSVYSGFYKIYELKKLLPDDGVLYPGDSFKVEMSSDQPVNILVVKDNELSTFKSGSITWDSNNNEWKYPARLEPVVKYDEITRKNFEFEIESIGKYSVCFDGRMSENDVFVVNDAAKIDVKITKL